MSTPEPKNQALQRIDTLKTAINEDYVQMQIKSALGENSPTFAASLIDLFTTDNYLQACDPKQVIMQAMKAALLKLPINKSLGFAYIVAYAGKPEFQIGYKGLIQLAIRTGQYRIIHAEEVYEGEYKTKNKLTGEFDLTGEKKSDIIIGYFAHFELNNGFSKTLFMTKEKVEAHAKKYSKSFNNTNGPWNKEFDAMAKKTVLRNLLNHYGLMTVEMAEVLDKDDVSDSVNNEIDNKGNSRTMSFNGVTEAEVVPTANTGINQSNPNPNTPPF